MTKQVNPLCAERYPATGDQTKEQACGSAHTECIGLCPYNFLMTTF